MPTRIYTHEDRRAQRDAAGRISGALGYADELPSADEEDGEQVSVWVSLGLLIFGSEVFAQVSGWCAWQDSNPRPAA